MSFLSISSRFERFDQIEDKFHDCGFFGWEEGEERGCWKFWLRGFDLCCIVSV